MTKKVLLYAFLMIGSSVALAGKEVRQVNELPLLKTLESNYQTRVRMISDYDTVQAIIKKNGRDGRIEILGSRDTDPTRLGRSQYWLTGGKSDAGEACSLNLDHIKNIESLYFELSLDGETRSLGIWSKNYNHPRISESKTSVTLKHSAFLGNDDVATLRMVGGRLEVLVKNNDRKCTSKEQDGWGGDICKKPYWSKRQMSCRF